MLTMLALGTSALVAGAQDAGSPPSDNQRPPRQDGQNWPGGPGMNGHRPPPPAIIGALDANHDGVIDADEIANAPAALKSLDKNGDGKLTPDEYIGKRRPHENPDGKNDSLPPNGVPPGPPPGQQ